MRHKILLLLPFVLLLASSCSFNFLSNRVLTNARHISNFTRDGDSLYFGAGYQLYRVNLTTRTIEAVYTTDRIMVEQPIIADGVAYFGGSSYANRQGRYGEKQGLLAVQLQDRKLLWKFPLGVGGYGTYGTYPVLAGDRIMVCARQHLHCLDRTSGREVWQLDNWFGRTVDGVTVPYVTGNHVYYKINEEYFTKKSDIDGHWAKVALDSGLREAVLPFAETPGKYHDKEGEGIGILSDGVVYGATRYDLAEYPSSRFGALDLEAGKRLWEVRGSSLRTRPALNDRLVFTVIDDAIQALDRKTGKLVWREPLGEVGETNLDGSNERGRLDYEQEWSRRLDATNEVLVVRASKGIVARRADNGKLLWLVKTEPDEGDADPVIINQMVILSDEKNCSVFALELKSGEELWRVGVPDCTYYYYSDD